MNKAPLPNQSLPFSLKEKGSSGPGGGQQCKSKFLAGEPDSSHLWLARAPLAPVASANTIPGKHCHESTQRKPMPTMSRNTSKDHNNPFALSFVGDVLRESRYHKHILSVDGNNFGTFRLSRILPIMCQLQFCLPLIRHPA